MTYKVRLEANLGWRDAVANNISDDVLAKCRENEIVEADEKLAQILINKLRIGREVKPETKGAK